jgi:hypothetical protein
MLNNFENRMPASGKEQAWQVFCPFCGARYDSNEARIVSEKEGAFLLHTDCRSCGSSVVAALIANQLGISSVGLITDLIFEDVVKFKENEAISPDEVLDVYTILERKSESLPNLLG